MKKIFKGLICAGLCGLLAIGAAGCKTDPPASEHRDPETAPLRLAVGALDRKFHPLLYTSQNDGTIANMTQIALMTADSTGTLAYGDAEPTVTLDYREVYKNASGATVATSDGKDDKKLQSVNIGKDGSTTYEFLIKNGIKFSDGEDLTIMDVLFNLYVYLDPAYTGSSTIYSTKIKGLRAYRLQDPDATEDDSESETNMQYYSAASQRIATLKEWAEKNRFITVDPETKKVVDSEDLEGFKGDIQTVIDLYREELETDWNSLASGWEEAYAEYTFTEIWQPFFLMEGLIQIETDPGTGAPIKDENEKYVTTLDNGDIDDIVDEINEASSPAKVQEYLESHEGITEEYAKTELQKQYAINQLWDSYTGSGSGIAHILTYTNTQFTARDQFFQEERSKDINAGEVKVPSISGITVSHTDAAEYDGKFNGKDYDEKHDILRITINGADPKAKWNFSFPVAPMHYYSDKAHYDAAMAEYNGGALDCNLYKGTATHFGVERDNTDWFNDVLAEISKTRVPMGAGAYKCCTYKFGSEGLSSETFFYGGKTFFERNEQFTTLGEGVENAKIKYVTYQETKDDKIVEALKTGTIDYGEPVAKATTITDLNTGNLKQIHYATGGYGYIGINPKYVPDIEVRQAIMHALNTSSIFDYYANKYAEPIHRPMSTTSWAYPKGAERKYEQWQDDAEGRNKIIELVKSSGNWDYKNGKLVDESGNQLKLTFTIAGESKDHPAYNVLKDAERFLDKCGFDISVVNDLQALNSLATGNLTVWAAAWSSSIDPDPYQIYSLDSQASSTKNWNKEGILLNEGGKFDEELEIATELNKLIIQGRETLNKTSREFIYAQCLDLIMDLAVEFPTYQRHDLCVYNSAVIDVNSMTKKPSYMMGPIGELWKITYTP